MSLGTESWMTVGSPLNSWSFGVTPHCSKALGASIQWLSAFAVHWSHLGALKKQTKELPQNPDAWFPSQEILM